MIDKEKPTDLPSELDPLWEVWLTHPANESITFLQWLTNIRDYLNEG